MTPAERLLAAADLLDKRASAATGGPWREGGVGEFGWTVTGASDPFVCETADDERGKADAAYITTVGPDAGLLLAKVLRKEAGRIDTVSGIWDGDDDMLDLAYSINQR